MEKRIGLQEKGRGDDMGKKLSYRDVAARGISSSASNPSLMPGPTKEGFGHVQPDPAVVSTVVAAVMAALAGGNHRF